MKKEELKKELIKFLAFEHTELNTLKKSTYTFEAIANEYIKSIPEPEEKIPKFKKSELEKH